MMENQASSSRPHCLHASAILSKSSVEQIPPPTANSLYLSPTTIAFISYHSNKSSRKPKSCKQRDYLARPKPRSTTPSPPSSNNTKFPHYTSFQPGPVQPAWPKHANTSPDSDSHLGHVRRARGAHAIPSSLWTQGTTS
jgi:hypothetical protein